MNSNSDFDPKLLKKLAALQTPEVRNPEKARTGRVKFLQEARDLNLGVTPNEIKRHKRWLDPFQALFTARRKEFSPMVNTLATIALIVSLIIGGGGATVAAAQGSQPEDLLYELKILSEDFRLNIDSDPESQYQTALDFASRRIVEINNTIAEGGIPSDAVLTRYQKQVEQSIRYALNLPDAEAIQALEKIQTRLQTQEQALLQIQANGSLLAEATLLQTREMIQTRMQWVEVGLSDPIQLRDQIRLRDRDREQDQDCTATPNSSKTPTAPGNGDGNPWTTGTPTQGSGYGPGPGPEPSSTCTPKYGQTSQPTKQPTTQPNKPTDAGPNPTQSPNKPTDSGPHVTPDPNQPTTQPTHQPTHQPQPQPTKKPGK